MRTFITILLIALLSGIATYFFPWWMIAVVSFLVVVIRKPKKAFWSGFAGIALLWLIAILFHDIPNDHILSTRMAGLFSLPNSILFIIVNILIGGLVGGMAACSAATINKLFRAA